MSGKSHSYGIAVEWTGNRGTGTSGYTAYSRDHVIRADDKPDIPGSADPAFRGDRSRYNPEDLLVASVSTCHMLWYLHLASDAGIVVTAYTDAATGTMIEDSARGGYFTAITLHPRVTIGAGGDSDLAAKLHERAHALCFVANSLNFPVACEPTIVSA